MPVEVALIIPSGLTVIVVPSTLTPPKTVSDAVGKVYSVALPPPVMSLPLYCKVPLLSDNLSSISLLLCSWLYPSVYSICSPLTDNFLLLPSIVAI